ncbi:MAG: hypothetical protein JXR96_11765 [Deltaproteobacteria bacterium]|nr:hypothetical protein [Deltaproteobacteria bacterium]
MRLGWKALLFCLLAAGCAESETCEPGYCGPHGTCVVVDGQPSCVCDEGYEQGPGLSCAAVKARMGEACEQAEDCEDGLCWDGYCTRTGCADHDDCVNLGADHDATGMCCAELEADDSVCVKIAPGQACGHNDQPCGASCNGAGDSACMPGSRCLGPVGDTIAVCAVECSDAFDCTGCQDPGQPGAIFECIPISGGSSYCLRAPQRCEHNADCEVEGEVCGVGTTADDELAGECGSWGELPTGAECDLDDWPPFESCAAFFCLNGYCSAVCQEDADCPAHMTCDAIRFIDLPDQSIHMCFGPGDAGPGDPCPQDGVNPEADLCRAGLKCLAYDLDSRHPCEDDNDCVFFIPGPNNPDCVEAEGICGSSFCAAPCGDSPQCEGAFYPVWIWDGDEHVCYCIPSTAFSGTAGPGDPCPFGRTNAIYDYCQVGLFCLGYDTIEACETDGDCGLVLPQAENPDCTAEGLCGASFCAAYCDESGGCDEGSHPVEMEGECYCTPD